MYAPSSAQGTEILPIGVRMYRCALLVGILASKLDSTTSAAVSPMTAGAQILYLTHRRGGNTRSDMEHAACAVQWSRPCRVLLTGLLVPYLSTVCGLHHLGAPRAARARAPSGATGPTNTYQVVGSLRRMIADAMPKLKTFGTGKSAFEITPEEVAIFDYNVSSPDSYGVMTHL